MCACKGETHVANYFKYKLSRSSNVSINIVEPNKTLALHIAKVMSLNLDGKQDSNVLQ